MTKEIGSWGIDGMIAAYEYRDFRVYKLAEPSSYIDIKLRGNGVQIPNKEARDIAHWILENVPEAPARDREADMRKLAEVVLSHMAEFFTLDFSFALNDVVQMTEDSSRRIAVLRILDVEPESLDKDGSYSTEQLTYAEELLFSFPAWIRDRALGTGGE